MWSGRRWATESSSPSRESKASFPAPAAKTTARGSSVASADPFRRMTRLTLPPCDANSIPSGPSTAIRLAGCARAIVFSTDLVSNTGSSTRSTAPGASRMSAGRSSRSTVDGFVRSAALAPSMPSRDASESVRQSQVHGEDITASERSGPSWGSPEARSAQSAGISLMGLAAERSRSLRVYLRPPWMMP